ncbi:MAG TPA: class I tRNA ligase family protein, partial [Xanthobacteraceae bacterium]|nr:class I tRNA ligase family protein [Xanthobacteraceae bacterium]
MAKKKKRRAAKAPKKKMKGRKKPAKKSAKKQSKRSVKRPAKSPAKKKTAIKKHAKTASAVKPAARREYYVTTAISYPNGAPHIGHAYEAIATDAIARFHRLDGQDVFFQTGVDEHGLKMTQTAAKEGISARELSNRNTPLFQAMCDKLNISYDRFIRTTEDAHYKASQAIWQKMADSGDIYLGNYEGWYSVRDEAFYAESETTVGDDNVRRGPQGTPVE